MSRSYSVKTTALTLGVTAKWIDNILSHHAVPGVVSERQGVERAISDIGLKVLELVRIATQELGIPIARSVKIASAAAVNPDAKFSTASGIELRFALDRIDRRLRERLTDAIEATPRLPRGRPRKSS